MDEYPSCPICFDFYGIEQTHIKAPKVLTCGDSLCKECLAGIIKKSQTDFILCPICQKEEKIYKNLDDYITNKELIRLMNAYFNISKKDIDNDDENKPISYKIITLGDSGVGKTSIFARLLTEKFEGNYKSTLTVEISTPYYVKYKKNKYELFFYDTFGQEKMSSILPKNYLRESDGVFFIFDISNQDSFINLEKWYTLYKNQKENVVGILIGNKCDNERQVEYNTAKKFAEEHDLKYLETSAKLDKNVKKAIATLLEQIIESQKKLYINITPLNKSPSFNISKEKQKEKKGCCSRSKKK